MTTYQSYKPDEVQAELRTILPEEAISVGFFERVTNALDAYTSSDEIRREAVPYAVVWPRSANDVSQVLTYANHKRIPVFVRGSGTSLHGVSKYRTQGIVINTSRLKHFNLEKNNGYAEFGPGHRVLGVRQELEKEGYFLPLIPGSLKVASIGGIIANNTSGHVVDSSIGKPRDYVLGLQVVLPTGEIIETGTKGLRRAAGTDLTQYFVGGDGLLGVITGIRMRLIPLFENAYGVAYFSDELSAARAVQQVYWQQAPMPLLMEFLDTRAAKLCFALQNLPEPVGPVLMLNAIGRTEDEATQKINALVDVIRRQPVLEAKRIDDISEWRRIWQARDSATSYICQRGKGVFGLCEIASTVGDLVNCMKDTMNMSDGMPTLSKLGAPYLTGHLGALCLHPVYVFPAEWSAEEKNNGIEEIFFKESQINRKYGTSGGELGQFGKRTQFYPQRYGEKSYWLVKEIKKVFDPNNILNPDTFRD